MMQRSMTALNAEQRGESRIKSLFWLAAAVFAAALWGWTIKHD